ncbi:MAG: tRNA uridine-5-carboxymethylaminomethyl(34) synthesis GTPase MnmE [Candidatus Omnitrophica bacterium]|nr:tRNA uridine-5-carboxymethylaminomethyl(34) synthesis GTPase MnmE [Candidatus Omnitrophota bacterium]
MAEGNLTDTIAAISTPVGEGGIGIVRISGKDALEIADKIFISPRGLKPSGFKTHTIHYGTVTDKDKLIDEVILAVMLAPKSYTREDTVEINCHSGIVALRDTLEIVLKCGARMAEPGEFTKRAFLSGRIDLAQAEAVLDIIRAKTDSALKIGVNQLKGFLSKRLNACRRMLIDMLSQLEASIDFPEEEGMSLDFNKITGLNIKVGSILDDLLDDSRLGRVFREGVHLVICGKPNVGKSSLLNALVRKERSIVTSVPGTTRDTIEEVIDICGIPVKIVDTAGILEPKDLVEKKAISRSKQEINSADLVIILFDGSSKLSKEDYLLINKLKKKKAIAVINKSDLRQKVERERILKDFDIVVDISARRLKNIGLLEKAITGLIYGGIIINPESVMVSNLRHIQLLLKAQKNIAQIQKSLDNKLSVEFIAHDAREALGFLDDILGKRFSLDLLDKIFSEFCIGK